MNYDEHVLAGIVTYPIAILILSTLDFRLGLPLDLTFMAMSLGYAFYVLGSDLPDLDHPDALIHRVAKPFVSVAVGISAFMNLGPALHLAPDPAVNLALAWSVAALAAVVAWNLFKVLMPNHRGVVHSSVFAAVYALLAFAIVRFGFDMSAGEALFVASASFLGYNLHLVLDKSLKMT
ncbi:metal-dependent hydrolase [Methanocrinis sp.]|uniref:metal-dependent hydrolase n=1 Tax=Methanocrinis sp. TaxID=3101522 RepID=UPI003D0C3CE0